MAGMVTVPVLCTSAAWQTNNPMIAGTVRVVHRGSWIRMRSVHNRVKGGGDHACRQHPQGTASTTTTTWVGAGRRTWPRHVNGFEEAVRYTSPSSS